MEARAKDEAKPVPTGVELTALDETFRRDPYPPMADLLARDPVHYDAAIKRWVLTRHDDVDTLLRDRTMAADARKALPGTYMELFKPRDGREPSMLMIDDPDHGRLRGLVNKAFTPKAVESMRPRIAAIADELLDAMGTGDEADVIADFSGPLPTIVIAEMLGVDPADRDDFKRWSDIGVMTFDPLLSAEGRKMVEESQEALGAYLLRAIEERRAAPGDDLISGMIAAQDAGDSLTTEEIVTMCGLLLAAGNVTTTDLIGNGVLALLQHPEQARMLRDDPSLIKNAVEEMLRYDSPVIETARVTQADVEIAGCPVKHGESVLVFLGAANRDPNVYAEPDRFDITRTDSHHHSFGGGIHFCLGAPLARLEAQIAIPALMDRFPNMRLAIPPYELEWRPLPAFRGLTRLPVHLR